jgi:hypothetical protein
LQVTPGGRHRNLPFLFLWHSPCFPFTASTIQSTKDPWEIAMDARPTTTAPLAQPVPVQAGGHPSSNPPCSNEPTDTPSDPKGETTMKKFLIALMRSLATMHT